MKKALMIASMASMLRNFNLNNIRILRDLGYEVTLAANFRTEDSNSPESIQEFRQQMNKEGVLIRQIDFTRKIGNIKGHIKSYKQVQEFANENFDLIHCHSPICAAITRYVFRRKPGKIIYTAHGFHFYKGAPLQNWLLYYPVEKWLSRYTDVLITINKEDYQRAKKKFHAKETKYIPGVGIDVEKIQAVQVDREKKREELGIGKDDFLLLSVGELNKNKNHEVVIRAIAELRNPKIKYAICGKGPLKEYLEELAEKLGVRNQLFLLGFRTDVIEICKSADVFVFPSKREGLSVALMEAMACGLPCVVSRIRGNVDLVNNGQGGWVMNSFLGEDFSKKVCELMEDKSEKYIFGKCNQKIIVKFDIAAIKKKMQYIYFSG